MSSPTPPPKYIYKIVPPSTPPPSPLPLSLPVSALDAGDNFIHASTSAQILRTLINFFAEEAYVYILRIPFERVEKLVKWEDVQGKQPVEEGGSWDTATNAAYFPHLHGNGLKLGREEVDEVGAWKRGVDGWNVEGWPFGEDMPIKR